MTIEKIDLARLIALKVAAEKAAAAGAEGPVSSGAEGAGPGRTQGASMAFAEAAAGVERNEFRSTVLANEGEDSAAPIRNPQSGDRGGRPIRNPNAPHGDGESFRRPLPIGPKGRPRKVDATIKELIPRLLSRGYTLKEAAAFAGCHEKTIRRARRSDPDFDEQIHRAGEVTGSELKEVVEQAGFQSWRAAAWMLKHQQQRADRDRKLRELVREINSFEDPEDEVLKVVEDPNFYDPPANRRQPQNDQSPQ